MHGDEPRRTERIGRLDRYPADSDLAEAVPRPPTGPAAPISAPTTGRRRRMGATRPITADSPVRHEHYDLVELSVEVGDSDDDQ